MFDLFGTVLLFALMVGSWIAGVFWIIWGLASTTKGVSEANCWFRIGFGFALLTISGWVFWEQSSPGLFRSIDKWGTLACAGLAVLCFVFSGLTAIFRDPAVRSKPEPQSKVIDGEVVE